VHVDQLRRTAARLSMPPLSRAGISVSERLVVRHIWRQVGRRWPENAHVFFSRLPWVRAIHPAAVGSHNGNLLADPRSAINIRQPSIHNLQAFVSSST